MVLPHGLEEAAGQPTTQHVDAERQSVATRIIAPQSQPAPGHVCRLGLARQAPGLDRLGDRSRTDRRSTPGPAGEGLGHLGHQSVVVDGACRSHHEVGRPVPVVVEPDDVVTVDGSHRGLRAQHLPPQWMLREEGLVEQTEDHVIGVIGLEVDLLEDHLTLGLDVSSTYGRIPQDVGQQGGGHLLAPCRHTGVVRRVLLGGERVHLATGGVHQLRYGARRPALGSLEEQVLQEVRGAAHGQILVTPTDGDPHPYRDRVGVRHQLGHHTRTGKWTVLGQAQFNHRSGGHAVAAWATLVQRDAQRPRR